MDAGIQIKFGELLSECDKSAILPESLDWTYHFEKTCDYFEWRYYRQEYNLASFGLQNNRYRHVSLHSAEYHLEILLNQHVVKTVFRFSEKFFERHKTFNERFVVMVTRFNLSIPCVENMANPRIFTIPPIDLDESRTI